MGVEESRSEVEEFAGDCKKSESGRSAAVEVKADGLVMIPVVGKMRGKREGDGFVEEEEKWHSFPAAAAATAA